MAEYRLTELAATSGVTSRNIRAYRERGLIDPPRRVGRSALYDDRHLAQLDAITRLLARGFTFAHIADFLTAVRDGVDIADMLGIHESVFGRAPARQEKPAPGG
jgi:DNA-binding transcriptional MerR regulator